DAVAGISGSGSSSLEGVSPSLSYYSGTYTSASQLAGLTPLSAAPSQAGSYTVLASFAGSTDYTTGSALANFTIAQSTPAVGVSDPGGTYNDTAFPATATVAGISGSGGSGLEGVSPSLSYYSGTYTSAAQLSGLTPLSAAPSQAGSYTVLASFAGSTDYTTGSALANVTITQATPAVGVSDPGGTYNDTAFPATATVAGVSGSAASSLEGVIPSLSYYSGTYTSAAQLSGLTPLSAAPSQAGSYTVLASFAGSTDYTARSALANFTVAKATPSLNLASSGGSAVFGQPVTFVATVAAAVTGAGTPGGTVTFLDGTNPLATVPLDGSGRATLTTSDLGLGSHSITTTYNGGAGFLGVQSGSAPESVAQAGTQVVLVRHPVFKKKKLVSVGLTAEIEPFAPGGGVPTGSVAFELLTKKRKKIQTKTLGTVALSAGEATLTLKANQMLGKAITIVYGGDTNFRASTASPPKLTQKGLKSLARPMVAFLNRAGVRPAVATASDHGVRP
ncbi:MAG: Ig-like domain repeat protein, partial [Isosphaerales bacterium]